MSLILALDRRSYSTLRGLLWVLLAFAIAGSAAASPRVEEADDTLLTTKNTRMLEAVQKTGLNLPMDVGPNEAQIVVTMGGAYIQVFARAKPEGSAKKLGHDISTALGTSPLAWDSVRYASEEGYAVATCSYSSAQFGRRSGGLEFPVGAAAGSLSAAGWRTSVVMRIAPSVDVRMDGLPEGTGQNWRWWGATNPPQSAAARTSVTIPPVALYLFWLFLVGPWVTAPVTLLVALLYARSNAIPLERRRAVYPKLVIWPVYGSIFVNLPLAAWLLGGRGYRPFVDLWFGTYSVSVLIPLIMLSMPLMFVLLPFLTTVERRIFGPSPTEPKPPQMAPDEKAVRLRIARLSLIPVAIGVAIIISSAFVPKSAKAAQPLLFIAGMMVSQFGGTVVTKRFKDTLSLFDAPSKDGALEARLGDLARRMGVKPPALRIDGGPAGRAAASASVGLDGKVCVSARACEVLDEREMDAILAHELAHLKGGHPRHRFYLVLVVSTLMTLPIMATLFLGPSLSLPANWRYIAFAPMLVSFPLFTIWGRWSSRTREYYADRLALETTRAPDALISALQKLQANSPTPHMAEVETASTHPAMSKRIARIQELARQMGLR